MSHASLTRRVGTALALLLPLALPVAAATNPLRMKWTVGNDVREAIVYPPAPTTRAVKHPLVFAFHGHGGNMKGTAVLMHFQTLWPQAVVVYPQGLPSPSPHDPAGLKPGWQFVAGDSGGRDLAFFDAMLADLQQKYAIDPDRVYVSGFSNGAVFSYLLWAERASAIGAVGVTAGLLASPETLAQPRSLIHIGGSADTTAPFDLQMQTVEMARQADSATGSGGPCGAGCTLYASTAQTPVMTVIHAGGHVWPPWASTRIVNFFKTHKRP
jgi:polyhydroxybutyrate depolymerase